MMYPKLFIVSGVILILIGYGYAFRYDVIERLRTLIRDALLNDSYIALERRKWGLFFLLVGAAFLYAGLSALPPKGHP